MTSVKITVPLANKSDLCFALSFRGMPRGKTERTETTFSILTAIPYREDFEKFQSAFLTRLNPTIELV